MIFNNPEYMSFLVKYGPLIVIIWLSAIVAIGAIINWLDITESSPILIIVNIAYLIVLFVFAISTLLIFILPQLPKNLILKIGLNNIWLTLWGYNGVTFAFFISMLTSVFLSKKVQIVSKTQVILTLITSFIYPLLISKHYFFILKLAEIKAQHP